MKTAQEIFTEVYNHLIRQSAKAEDQIQRQSGDSPVKMCAYRTPSGLKCAAGCLILDKHYSKEFEARTVSDREIQEALIKSDVDMNDLKIAGLVAELQNTHDFTPVALWGLVLRETAERRGLTVPLS